MAGSSGTVTVQGGGVLETSEIDSGSGTASVTLDGGVLRAMQSDSTFFNSFTAIWAGPASSAEVSS
jgi:fibronectin-binding autotransporter adhesin